MDVIGKTPESNYGKYGRHYILLTSEGQKTDFSNDILILDNAQEIVNAFDNEISNSDPVVSQYYLESIRACQENLCISSAICLGGASERTIDLLAEAIAKRYPQFQNIENGRTAHKVNYLLADKKRFRDIFDFVVDNSFKGDLTEKLKMEYLFRLGRNDAGHPVCVAVIERYEQVCFLVSFRKYAKTIFRAIELLDPSP